MAWPTKRSLRLVKNSCAVNEQFEDVSGLVPNQEVKRVELRRSTNFGKINLVQGYLQMPLSAAIQEMFQIATPGGVFTPS